MWGQSGQIIVLIYPFSSTGAGDIYTSNCPDSAFKGFKYSRFFHYPVPFDWNGNYTVSIAPIDYSDVRSVSGIEI